MLAEIDQMLDDAVSRNKGVARAELWAEIISTLSPEDAEWLQGEYADREMAQAVAGRDASSGRKRELIDATIAASEARTKAASEVASANAEAEKLRKAQARLNARATTTRARIGELTQAGIIRQVELMGEGTVSDPFETYDYADVRAAQAELSNLLVSVAGVAELLLPVSVKRAEAARVDAMTREGRMYITIADLLDYLTAERMQSAKMLQTNLVVDTSTGRSGSFRKKAKSLLDAAESQRTRLHLEANR